MVRISKAGVPMPGPKKETETEYISRRNEEEHRKALKYLSKSYTFKEVAKDVNLRDFAYSHKETIRILAALEKKRDAVLKEVSAVFKDIDKPNVSDAKAKRVFQKLMLHLETLLSEEDRMRAMVFETKRKAELIDDQVGEKYNALKKIFGNKSVEMNLKYKGKMEAIDQEYKKKLEILNAGRKQQETKAHEEKEKERLSLEVEREQATNDLAKAVEIVTRLDVTFNHTLADIRQKIIGMRTILQTMHQAADKAGVDIGSIPAMIHGTERSRLDTVLKDLKRHTLGP